MNDETLLEFPTRFPIKIVGANDGSFQEHATALVAAHAGPLHVADIQSRRSRNGRFLSVTIHVWAHSKPQLDAIYQSLTASERVLMAL